MGGGKVDVSFGKTNQVRIESKKKVGGTLEPFSGEGESKGAFQRRLEDMVRGDGDQKGWAIKKGLKRIRRINHTARQRHGV